MRIIISEFSNEQATGRNFGRIQVRKKLVSDVKIQALEMIIQSGRKLGFKKTIRQGRAMGLGDDRNVIKRTFLAVSEKTPFYEKRFV